MSPTVRVAVAAALGALSLHQSGCATAPTSPEAAVAYHRADARAGDPRAGLAIARLVAAHGPRAASLDEGVDAARAALPHPEARLWAATFLEGLGRDTEAAQVWLEAAVDRDAPAALAAVASIRLLGLVDRVTVDDALAAALQAGLERSGAAGVHLAEVLEAVATRLPEGPTAARALAEARARLGTIARYQLVGRVARGADAADPTPLGAPPAPTDRPTETLGEPGAAQAHTTSTRSGRIGLPPGASGVWAVFVEAPPIAPPTGEVELEIVGAAGVRAFVDGTPLLDHPRLDAVRPTRVRARFGPVPNGWIELHFAIRGGAVDPRVMVRTTRAARDDDTEPLSLTALDAAGFGSLAAAWLRHEVALAADDREASHAAEAWLDPTVPLHALHVAQSRLDDLSRPLDAARSEAVGLLTAALGAQEVSVPTSLGEPALAAARALLTSLLLDDGDVTRAAAFASAGPLGEHLERITLELALAERRPARRAAAALRARLPRSCAASTRWLEASWERLKTDPSVRVDDLPRCPALRLRAAGLLREAWRLDDAAALLDAVIASEDAGALRARALVARGHVALAAGALDDAWRLATRALIEPGDDEAALEVALRAARLSGDPGRVEAVLKALRETPGTSSLSRRHTLAWRDDLGLPLVDGLELAERAARTGPGDGSHEVLLEDRFTRVFADGAMLHRVHRVVRLLEANAVDEFGEVALPDDAEVLRARTLKPYGAGRFQPIEPEDFVEKRTISLPALEPGVVAEVAYFWWSHPDALLAPGWRAPAHRFASGRGATRWSRYTVVTPAAHPIEVIAEAGAPEPRRPEPGVLVFEAFDAPRVLAEPDDPRPERQRAGVVVQSRVDAEATIRALRDAVAQNLAVTPTVRALAAEALGDATDDDPPEERLARLFRFVSTSVRATGESPLRASASHAAVRRAGDRATLLTALCRAAGLRCDLVLVRPWGFGTPDPRLFEHEDYLYPVVRARVGAADRWLDPSNRFGPFDHLPPLVQAAEAIALSGSAGRIVTPRTLAHEGRRTITGQVTIAPGGETWAAEGEDRLSGMYAMTWRRALLEMAPERRARVLEAIVGQSFPGAEVEAVETSELDTDGPLELRWRVAGRTLAHGVDRRLVTVALAPEHLERGTVRLPVRRAPLLVNRAVSLTFHLRIRLPADLMVARAPDPIDVDHPLVTLTRRTEMAGDGGALEVSKTFSLTAGIVEPPAYGDWRDAARAVDDADVLHIALEPRAPGAPHDPR